MNRNVAFCGLAVTVLAAARLIAAPTASEFTYQGSLQDHGSPANGRYDLTFRLFDAASAGNAAGGYVTNSNVGVTNGLFLARLDFGSPVFNGTAYWLEIGVKTNGAATFTILSPRQPLSPSPYALYAPTAGAAGTAALASSLTANTVTTASLQDASVTAGKIGQNQVVKTVNGLRDNVVLGTQGVLEMTTNGNQLTLSAPAWSLNGNAGTTMGSQVLGTTDFQPLGIVVDNVYALRFEPPPYGLSPNLIGGFSSVSEGLFGATIAGGGQTNLPNSLAEIFTFIGGGRGNSIDQGSWDATIAGGYLNLIGTDAFSGVIGGGEYNTLYSGAQYATIAGGRSGYVGSNALAAVIGGGLSNWIEDEAQNSTIAGGAGNHLGYYAWGAAVLGGEQNSIEESTYNATIGGGYLNTNRASYAVVAGGATNEIGAGAEGAVIAGGLYNYIADNSIGSTIGGGRDHMITDSYRGTIAGGEYNAIDSLADYSTVSGGFDNWIQEGAMYATIPGGAGATARNYGQLAYASGTTSSYGDAQTSLYVLRGNTTNASKAELFLDGASQRMNILTNMTWSFQVMIVGTSSAGSSACYEFKGGIKNVGGTVSFIGGGTSSNAVAVATDIVGLTAPQVVADNTNKCLAIKVTGSSARAMRWVARVQTTEVRFM